MLPPVTLPPLLFYELWYHRWLRLLFAALPLFSCWCCCSPSLACVWGLQQRRRWPFFGVTAAIFRGLQSCGASRVRRAINEGVILLLLIHCIASFHTPYDLKHKNKYIENETVILACMFLRKYSLIREPAQGKHCTQLQPTTWTKVDYQNTVIVMDARLCCMFVQCWSYIWR